MHDETWFERGGDLEYGLALLERQERRNNRASRLAVSPPFVLDCQPNSTVAAKIAAVASPVGSRSPWSERCRWRSPRLTVVRSRPWNLSTRMRQPSLEFS